MNRIASSANGRFADSRTTRLASFSLTLLGLVAAVVTSGCGSDGSNLQAGEAPEYSVELYVESAGRLGALQFDITHLGNSGGFLGRADGIDCVALVEAIVASNNPGERTAKVGMISLQGIETPAAILRCGFRTREELTPDDFLIDVTDASDTDSRPLDPYPSVVVSTISPR